MDDFAARLRAEQVARGLSAAQLAAAAGLGPDRVRNIYRGRAPSVQTAAALAAALGITTSELLGEAAPPPQHAAPLSLVHDAVTGVLHALAQAGFRADPEQVADLVVMACRRHAEDPDAAAHWDLVLRTLAQTVKSA